MRYLKELTWEVVPLTIPKVKKSCSKCGQHALFQNSEKFRVNANKNKIDIWLIYQCEKCKTTWNMTIHERIAPDDIPSGEYDLFMNNDATLAKWYGFNKLIHSQNRIQVAYDTVTYEVIGEAINTVMLEDNPLESIGITIICKMPFELRLEKVLSQKLGVSRSKIKKLCLEKAIIKENQAMLSKDKLNDSSKLEIRSLNTVST